MSSLFWFYYRTVTVGLLGLLCGSFLNVCIYRLPKKESVAQGNSYCPHCQHKLAALDLIPLLSYLFLKGRCRYCKQPISPRYARIEALTGFCFALAAALWGSGRLSPAWSRPARPAWTGPDAVFNGLVIGLVLFSFCALLVWAMIRKDQADPPWSLYAFIGLPALLRLVLEPDKAIWLAGTSLVLFLFFFLAGRLQAKLAQSHNLAGLALAGLWAGPAALVPGLAVLGWLLAARKKKATAWQPPFLIACFLLMLFFNP